MKSSIKIFSSISFESVERQETLHRYLQNQCIPFVELNNLSEEWHTNLDLELIRQILCEAMHEIDCLIVYSSGYERYRPIVDLEMMTAHFYSKTIIVLRPWNHLHLSAEFDNYDAIYCDWVSKKFIFTIAQLLFNGNIPTIKKRGRKRKS